VSLGSSSDIVYQLSQLVFQTIVGPFRRSSSTGRCRSCCTRCARPAPTTYTKNGHEQNGDQGINAQRRYKNYVPVKRIKCKDYLCDMETVRVNYEKRI
jgi:hypothetical protein